MYDLLLEGSEESFDHPVGLGFADEGVARDDAPELGEFKRSSQHLTEAFAMKRQKRRSDRAGRAPLPSPGRPPVAGRDERGRFWAAIATGVSSENAAAAAGISQAIGARWFRKAGGMPPAKLGALAKPLSGRYLSFAEREEIALLRARGCTMQEVARRIGRAASTISRELRRNASTRSGGLEYRPTTAQWHAERSARRPKEAKLALNPVLRVCVPRIISGHIGDADHRALAGRRSSQTLL